MRIALMFAGTFKELKERLAKISVIEWEMMKEGAKTKH